MLKSKNYNIAAYIIIFYEYKRNIPELNFYFISNIFCRIVFDICMEFFILTSNSKINCLHFH